MWGGFSAENETKLNAHDKVVDSASRLELQACESTAAIGLEDRPCRVGEGLRSLLGAINNKRRARRPAVRHGVNGFRIGMI